jgi:hypothetical protein
MEAMVGGGGLLFLLFLLFLLDLSLDVEVVEYTRRDGRAEFVVGMRFHLSVVGGTHGYSVYCGTSTCQY